MRFLQAEGVLVYECERPRRGERRRRKSDLIDARLAARRVVAGEGLSFPRGGGQREQLRLLLVERRGAVRARTAALNQLSALVGPRLIRFGVNWRRCPSSSWLATQPGFDQARSRSLRLQRIARRAERLSEEIAEIDRTLSTLVAEIAPRLLDECGVERHAPRN